MVRQEDNVANRLYLLLRRLYSDKAYLSLFMGVIASVLAYSTYSILKYYSLDASGWDLGVHAQVLWNTLHGNLFYSPLIGENLLAEHFAPFECLQLPIYYLFPTPISLLVFQSLFVALAALPLYLVSEIIFAGKIKSVRARKGISLAFGLSYLISPYTLSLISFDFHNISFLPFFLFLSFYSFLREKRLLTLVSLALIVSLHSNFIFMAATILLYEFLYLRTAGGKKIKTWLLPKADARTWMNTAFFIACIALLYGYLVLAGYLKGYLYGTPVLSAMATTGATGTPFTSVPGLIHLVFTDPASLFPYFVSNMNDKAMFFFILLGSLIFLPILSPMSLTLSVPFALYALPSNYAGYYGLGYQYTGMIVGAMYISALMGLYNLLEFLKRHDTFKIFQNESLKPESGIWGVTAAILVATILVVPIGIFSPSQVFEKPSNSQMVDVFDLHYNQEDSSFLVRAQSLIPANSYILTQNNLMPFFSDYANAYSTPWSPGISGNLSNFQYIVLQDGSYWAEVSSNVGSLQTIAHNYLDNGTFKVLQSDPSQNLYILVRTSL